ncbi:MAG TPA: sigma factor [Verrucomicrobiae bacterium]|nr:sigma factor [Verrucomicrobiae bacterium]
MRRLTSSSEAPQSFPPTRWSVVLAATRKDSPESAVALETICRAYWYPLYAYVRRSGQSPHDAQDLTQEFFCRLLEKRWLESVDSQKGRLRSFLMVAPKKFMSKEWRRDSAQAQDESSMRQTDDTHATSVSQTRYACTQ